ncbi:hypothetical protein [Clostridium cellulovorans]|uniref:Uncharacterized protein n=1 Tax=Clostridium cellulovorans (strain ATCC 35296 / DSM 3052 / OCM 3 / 743B) TaxID=573061 RepID=D9SUF6_CLOC7|nr:hypothetical protein [Clostridium cellulovorans]ADL52911.1 hypothetical protein Clocel_3225 [Clostridium cellulovorans 743B]
MIKAELIYLSFLIFALWSAYSLIRSRKLKDKTKKINEKHIVALKNDKLTIILAICACSIYSLIGYLFKIEILIPFEIYKNGGSINFVFPILLIITIVLLRPMIAFMMKKYKEKS